MSSGNVLIGRIRFAKLIGCFWISEALDSVNRIRASGCWTFIKDCQILITYFCSAGQLPFNSEYFHRRRIYADSQVIRVPRL